MRILIFFLLVLHFVSCSTIKRKLYVPTQVNNPYLKEKGDHSLSATYSSPTGLDVNGGVALTNRIAVIGGFNYYENGDGESNSSLFRTGDQTAFLRYKHKGFHAGIGGYFPLQKKKPTEFISVFGGLIKNRFTMKEELTDYSDPTVTTKFNFFNSDINRWFLQAGFNYYPDIFKVSFSSRFNYVVYNKISTDYTPIEQNSYNLPPVAYPKWSTFLDFSFDATCFFNKSKSLGVQVFSVFTTRIKRRDFDFYNYTLRKGFGIVYKRPSVKKKKTQ